eukprot:CAMPEP_0172569920 /NCGR_PEP_ID=MMETSP1067-20121228/125524_1 /TAXON_ID=265564 ORGANISM="Thalassiosira punctigera, Strain Tpunct2005C2" /NCGR_SAMPLE_ID=MMETSP1067 /ASSEMBLY_ACC=CAM_ASM_000444 /LENGTH=573 /DNA_ID=CAMNT_0013361873 /DNA_START=38 /DNA_END=1756 /DNA_ORIENTATION=-
MNSESSKSLDMIPERSIIRIVGVKNPILKGKIGTIVRYTRDGKRLMITLNEGEGGGLYKVKPSQVEVIEEPSGNVDLDIHRSLPRRKRRHAPVEENMEQPYQHRRHSPRHHQRNAHASRQYRNEIPSDIRVSQRRDHRGRGPTQAHFTEANARRSHRSENMHQRSVRESYRESFRDNTSHGSGASNCSQEIMETLRSADAMFDAADASGDGFVSQEEFEGYMMEHTNHDMGMIHDCYHMIDVDHNGTITREEVRQAYLRQRRGKKGCEVSQDAIPLEDELLAVSRDADAMFKQADFDGDGQISIREFELYMRRHTKHSLFAIRKIFSEMDTDQNGCVTRHEVRKVYMAQRRGGKKKSLMDILGLDDDDMRDIEDDVYSMFFLSDYGSPSFWFALCVFVLKLSLVIIVALDLFKTGIFPESSDISMEVKLTQFLLLPVNVSVQEELIATFFIYANLKWSIHILELNPGASKRKYHVANFIRFLDGLTFLFVNTVLLLQATDVLGALMNFTALEFLSSIDNVALFLARDGYLSENLEAVAGDVLLMKLPKNHDEKLQLMDSVMFIVMFLVQLVAW